MIDGMNRVILTVLALLLIAAGILALLAATELLTVAQPGVLRRQIGAATRADPGFWWPILVGGAVIIALLAAWWAARQVIVRRPGGSLSTVTLDSGDRGRTTVEAAKVAQAAAADLRRLPQVTSSSARLVANSQTRQLRTRVDVPADADLRSVRSAAGDVYDRVAAVLGADQLVTHTRIRPVATSQQPRRVR